MKHYVKSWGRAFKYGILKWRADRQLASSEISDQAPPGIGAAFLIGCGRSGTTVCGEVLRRHPQVKYFFEPYHLWAAIDPSIDVLNLYHLGISNLLLDSDRCSAESIRRFNRLLMHPAQGRHTSVMLEKTPSNACRIGYLDALAPNCKFIHLARDGVDVARSIDKLSRDRGYGIFGKPGLNRWWGRGGSKWTALAGDGVSYNYFVDELPLLQSFESKGAYEWLVSLAEIDRWRNRLGNRLFEVTYNQLTSEPQVVLRKMCDFLSLDVDQRWLVSAAKLVDKARSHYGIPLVLPPKMADSFNAYQRRFGFGNRAVAGKPQTGTMVQVAIVSNEPTPYRLHVLERLAKELDGIFIHNIFTHTISDPSMPWQMRIGAHLNPTFFPSHHLNPKRPISHRNVELFRDIRNFVIQHDVQMIILLGYNDLTRLLLIRWARTHGIPIVLAADSNIFADARARFWVRPIKTLLVRWVLRRLGGLMPMGTCGRAYFRSYLDHNLPEFLFPYEPDYETLQNVDLRAVDEFREKHDLDPNRRRLLYCGRLIEVKRVDVLIEAFARVALAQPEWDLVIAGAGPLREELEKRLPPILRCRVKWLGFMQFDQIVLAYHACHVLVHPSEYEPWALVINEAVACNLPVVATSVVGAAVELVRNRENGLIVSPRSAEAMTDAIWQITEGDCYLDMRARCGPILDSWRHAADPVDGVREALRYFGLLWRQPAEVVGQVESPAEPAESEEEVPVSPSEISPRAG